VKAAICYEFGKPLQIADVHLDPPQANEVQVRLAATAICHSDLHLLHGDWMGTLPIVAGHEAAGVVEEVGDGVTAVRRGDRVVISLLRSCGECYQCQHTQPHNCTGAFVLDTESRMRDGGGNAIQHGGLKTTAFAERTVVHQSQVVPVPAEMPLDRAALLGCGVITGYGAVQHTARVSANDSVVVIGAGGVGLNAIQSARLAGARPVVAIDRVESKLAVATQFGATHALAAGDPKETVRAVKKLIGRGADYVFVTVGIPELVAQAQMMIRPGGTVVIVGMPAVKSTVSLRMFDVVWSEQRILGSRMGSARLQEDVRRLVDLYLRGQWKLDELITARYPLAEINEALASMERGEALRNMIVF
jgi:S-(hydroxymethyl)glutathione dehydrogenase / alcohol dehydrogenase